MEYLKRAKYKVFITSESVNIDKNDLSYDEVISLLENLIATQHENDELILETRNALNNGFGFYGVTRSKFNFQVSASRDYVVDESALQTCPARFNTLGPWERKENIDTWNTSGEDKVCSFCGSLKPSRVIELVKEHGLNIIEPGKTGKYYVHRGDVPNAGFGGIKFYTYHFSPEQISEYNDFVTIK